MELNQYILYVDGVYFSCYYLYVYYTKGVCMENVLIKTKKEEGIDCIEQTSLDNFVNEIFTAIVDTFRFTESETRELYNSKVAKYIAAIPFVAGCQDAKRTALAHMAIYFTELRGGSTIFDHCNDDNASLLSRLRLISLFKGGNEKVIKHGMNYLALCMIDGYKASAMTDKENGVYNPLNDGSWDYAFLKTSLENDIKENPCEVLDQIIQSEQGVISRRWR